MASKHRILVMEDEWILAEATCDALQQAGFEVVGPTPKPEEALRRIEAEALDAATLDIRLKDNSGFAVAEELARRNIPFVFISGYTVRDLPEKFRGRPFLNKPATGAEVVRAISALLD